MKAKLIKHGHSYALLKDGKLIAFAHPEDFSNDHTIGKLSLKNCQAIERGYDLDELAEIKHPISMLFDHHSKHRDKYDCNLEKRNAFIEGAKTILEILGDKKFSEEKMKLFAEYVWKEVRSGRMKSMDELFNDWTSPQQTEWEVEIVGKELHEYNMCSNPKDHVSCFTPKLDAENCLILKRK